MKKRLMALLLCLAMTVAVFAGCGTSAANDGEIKATVFWYEESDVYLSSVRTALNKELEV